MQEEQTQKEQEIQEKKIIASRGIPSKEAMYLPAHDSQAIRTFQDGAENPTKNLWNFQEVLNFVFPKKYQEKYYHIALKFIELLSKKIKVSGEETSQFVKENNISKATFYNRVLPRLRRVGMIKIEREMKVEKESKKKFRPMIISLSKTFGNYLCKIGDSWLAFVDDAKSSQEQQKKLI
ncbi:MAG: hypothetical protein N3D10_03965 [Candidatus Micrarchaeota archaeon]|nr:hypothetical protein [Candidatus Micrarchaeota archaeon]